MHVKSKHARGRNVALAALLGSVLTAMPVPAAMNAVAAENPKATYLDVEAESANGPTGTTFVLTATVYDQFGVPFEKSNVNIKMWWLSGPNDQTSTGGASGSCT